MKKAIFAFVAVACAIVANAAVVNWGSGTIYIAGSADGTPGTSKANANTRAVTAYLFALTEADYNTASTMSASDLYNQYIVGGVAATTSRSTTPMGIANISQTVADAIGDVYGLVIYVDTITAAGYDGVDAFVKTGLAKADVGASGTYNIANMATQQSNWTAYSAVPEPTSAMLLVLGVAALALRRKQK